MIDVTPSIFVSLLTTFKSMCGIPIASTFMAFTLAFVVLCLAVSGTFWHANNVESSIIKGAGSNGFASNIHQVWDSLPHIAYWLQICLPFRLRLGSSFNKYCSLQCNPHPTNIQA